MTEKTATGIEGLDEMLEGGIPTGYTILVAGGPGSGKSTFAMQFLTNGVDKYGETGIYITLEENPKDMIRNFSSYGWDLSKIKIISMIPQKASIAQETKYVTGGEIVGGSGGGNTIELSPKKFSVDLVRDLIKEHVKESDAKRIVVDSLAALSVQLEDAFSIRQEILGLSNLLGELGCTSLLLTEMPEGQTGISRYGIEEFVCQGVIALYNIRKGSERVRGLEILKMRGTKHSQKICLMEMAAQGVVVYPNENLHSGTSGF
ncbi:MAG: ATPase domain-containing protein [Candidatus Hydrothermarchaeaceae archaeon]